MHDIKVKYRLDYFFLSSLFILCVSRVVQRYTQHIAQYDTNQKLKKIVQILSYYKYFILTNRILISNTALTVVYFPRSLSVYFVCHFSLTRGNYPRRNITYFLALYK